MQISAIAQAELVKAYLAAKSRFHGFMTALDQIVEEDFPGVDEPGKVTKYHVDALNDLTHRLSALVEGHEMQ